MNRTFFAGRFSVAMYLSLVGAVGATSAKAQELAETDTNANLAIAATVDGQPIYVNEVDREVAKVIRGREIEPAALKLLKAQALEQLIGQRLILSYLQERGSSASDQDLQLEIERIEKSLATQNLTLDDYLQKSGLSGAELQHALRWQMSWEKYLDRYLSDKNLETYFEKNRRQFDGTQLRVAHILLKVNSPDDKQSVEKALAQAAEIRNEIASGQVTFAQAAEKYSQSPSGKKGGDIGLISRHEPMPESFASPAFALDKDEISQPVVTPFGVHLIQCLEIKTGERTWQDARGELMPAVTRYLFDWIVQRERPNAQVEYTGTSPHFKPGTNELSN